MTRFKLLALDLDNTLFDSQKRVSLKNKKALFAARDKGVKVVLTTGRPLKAIDYLLKELDLLGEDNYLITFNGGLVQKTNGQVIDKSALTRQEVSLIREEMEKLSLPVDILSDGTVYSLSSRGNHSLYHQANPRLHFREISDLSDLPQDIVYNKAVIVFEPDFLDQQIPKIPASLRRQFEIFKSRELILEVMPKGVHKAVGLNLLCQHLGISRSQVMAMGDEENDLTMLEWAGLGIAMKNASDKIKQVADAVTEKDNNDSGVAWAIEKYILSED